MKLWHKQIEVIREYLESDKESINLRYPESMLQYPSVKKDLERDLRCVDEALLALAQIHQPEEVNERLLGMVKELMIHPREVVAVDAFNKTIDYKFTNPAYGKATALINEVEGK